MADVVNNSVTYLSNYITVNKGRKDGVEPDMGVVSERGVVGIVSTVSRPFFRCNPSVESEVQTELQGVGE